jgi:DNA polymerase III alpha subunit
LTERCLAAKRADREAFVQRLAEHAGERRMRYEPPSRIEPAAAHIEEEAEEPQAPGTEASEPGEKLISQDPEPGLFAGTPAEPVQTSLSVDAATSKTKRNSDAGFVVLNSVSEFYPHPASTPVQLAGRIRNLQTFRSSSGKKVGYFELIDSSGSVRIFVPAEPLARFDPWIKDGNEVVVRGVVRRRDGRQVCDALEIADSEGGIGLGKVSSDISSTRDP